MNSVKRVIHANDRTIRPVIYFPEIYIRLVKPTKRVEKNVVIFHVPRTMNKFDVKNYLEKIYNLDVTRVNTTAVLSKFYYDEQNNKIETTSGYKKAFVYLRDEMDAQLPFPSEEHVHDEPEAVKHARLEAEKEKRTLKKFSSSSHFNDGRNLVFGHHYTKIHENTPEAIHLNTEDENDALVKPLPKKDAISQKTTALLSPDIPSSAMSKEEYMKNVETIEHNKKTKEKKSFLKRLFGSG